MPKTTKPKNEEVVKEEPKKALTGVVNCNKLNVREKSDIVANVIKVIDKGTYVQIVAEPTDAWYKVSLPDGTKGFCMKEFISEEK